MLANSAPLAPFTRLLPTRARTSGSSTSASSSRRRWTSEAPSRVLAWSAKSVRCASSRSARKKGESSCVVPSRSPRVRPILRNVATVSSESCSSFKARCIAVAVQPGERRACGALLEAASRPQHMDPQAGHLALRAARRSGIGYFHPKLREAPSLVEFDLLAVDVRGVIDLEHHIRQLLADFHGWAARSVAGRMQIHGLIRLHDARLVAVPVAQQQVCAADGVDGRTPACGDDFRQARQPLGRILVVGRDLFGHHGDFRAGVPILEAPLPGVDLLPRDAYRPAAGKVRHRHTQPWVRAQRKASALRATFPVAERFGVRRRPIGCAGLGHVCSPLAAATGIVAQTSAPAPWRFLWKNEEYGARSLLLERGFRLARIVGQPLLKSTVGCARCSCHGGFFKQAASCD